MASWLKADGTVVAVKPKEGMFTIQELNDFVRGEHPDDQGYIEIVRPNLDGYKDLYLVVNEDGHRFQAPVNLKASAIYAQTLGDGQGWDLIVGNALLCDDTEID